jgi:2-polyprenyl-6-hydroxyphenyl methylase/3-demethylubiquinone-9 3-methyltransferase
MTNTRIIQAESSFKHMIEFDSLKGKSFLDIGSGSGLSSLVAKRMGAEVVSFDFDSSSVTCTKMLKLKYLPDNQEWKIFQGSILDKEFLLKLGTFDIVYSWGVLHHTGRMWESIDNSLMMVKKNGIFFIAIYNDEGVRSHIWWIIKAFYNHLPKFLQKPFAYTFGYLMHFLMLIKYTFLLKPRAKIDTILHYESLRGMSLNNDLVDWFGGFPFEFSKYNCLVSYIEGKGFKLKKGVEVENAGCHELVFTKI